MRYLWCNPNIPHYQRILLGAFYLPVLFWWWLVGNPIILLSKEQVSDNGIIWHSVSCPRCGLSYSEPLDMHSYKEQK